MSFAKSALSISTMWNFRRADSGESLIDQLTALGFERVELNYQVKTQWLPGIERRIRSGDVRISSVHNVFPKAEDKNFGPDSLMLGHPDEQMRQEALRLSRGSIDWACRLGAKAVVFHPTEVPLSPELYDAPLKKMAAAHETDTQAYRTLYQKMLSSRQAAPYIAQMMRSLEDLCEYVTRRGFDVKLGLENRAMCHQIPIYPEYDEILARFGGGPVGVWIDTGHGIMMQELGLQTLPLSKAAQDSLVGMHIHDAANARDHYAPCTLEGDVLEPFRPYIEKCPIRVLELSGRLSKQEILEGTERFIRRYGQAGYQA